MAPVLHQSSAKSTEVRALENERLVALERLHFATGTSEVKPDDKAGLDGLVACFSGSSESVIELRGYADGAGSAAQNLALSTERADAIARFLNERGIPLQRILILGLGEVDSDGPALKPEHQRVDLRVFEPATASSLGTGAVARAGK